jgi:hypothetical protein
MALRTSTAFHIDGTVGAEGRKLPVPTALMDKLRDRMIAKGDKPGDLIFPNIIGGVEGHFLRTCEDGKLSGTGTKF